jgi:VWFA-related protein
LCLTQSQFGGKLPETPYPCSVEAFFMMKFLFSFCTLILTILPLARPASPQAEKTQANIRVATGTVLLDVVVTDKRNRLVTDLTQDDFVVYEDDVAQKIDSFRLRSAPARAGNQPGPAPAGPSSYMIFLLDDSTTASENRGRVRDAAVRFLEKGLVPEDYVAIFYNNVGFRLLNEFTNDRSQLAAVLKQKDVPETTRTQTTGAPPTAPGSATAAASSVAAVNASLGATAGLSESAMQGISSRVGAAVGRADSAVEERTAYGVLAALESISRAVEPLEGRKTLVLFSQGFSLQGTHQERELERVIGVANKANVAIYAVDSGGLGAQSADLRLDEISAEGGSDRIRASGGRSVFDRAQAVGSDTRDSSLRYISTATGGVSFRNTNDLSSSLERIAQDMRGYFILGYRPSDQNFDGRFRKIRVELKKSGLVVRTRSGYIAGTARPELLTAEEGQLMTAARNTPAPSLPFDVALAQFPAGPQRSRVPITIEIPTRAIEFTGEGEKRIAVLLIVGLLRDQEGNVVTRVGTPVSVSATPEEYEVLEKGSVSFTNIIEVPPGRYAFEAFVRDQASGKGSVRDYSLQVASLEDKLLASSIVLSSQVDPLRDGETEGELVLGKAKLLPSARRQFRNGDNLIYLFNVYNVGQAKPAVEVRVSIERPGSSPMKLPPYRVEQLDSVPVPHVTVGRYVSLAGLPAGRYILSAEAEDLSSKQVCRARTSFEIVP